MKIYTKRGDGGETSLFDGTSSSKADPRIAAFGDVDELNAAVGMARRAAQDAGGLPDLDAILERVQRDLFSLGAVLADPRRDAASSDGAAPRSNPKQVPFGPDRAEALERAVDAWDAVLPPLRNFILPGGSAVACACHVARCVARRAERSVVALRAIGGGTPEAVVYLNRLSDMLFVAARLANARAGVTDVEWSA